MLDVRDLSFSYGKETILCSISRFFNNLYTSLLTTTIKMFFAYMIINISYVNVSHTIPILVNNERLIFLNSYMFS